MSSHRGPRESGVPPALAAAWGASLMLFLSTAPAMAQTPEGAAPPAGQNAPLFFLISVLCLFGYVIFNNFVLNGRLERLRNLRDLDDDAPRVSPFTRADLNHEGDGITIVGERVSISTAGLYLIGARDESLLTPLAANMLFQVLSRDEVAVLWLSQRVGRDELARLLVGLEAGVKWDGMAADERQRILRSGVLEKYESSLFVFDEMEWTPELLFAGLHQLKADAVDVAAVFVDDPALGRLDEVRACQIFDRLRLLSLKSNLPVAILLPMQQQDSRYWPGNASDRFQGILEFAPTSSDGGVLDLRFAKFPDAPSTLSLELDAASGHIVAR